MEGVLGVAARVHRFDGDGFPVHVVEDGPLAEEDESVRVAPVEDRDTVVEVGGDLVVPSALEP